ncbi:15724_t:CDS:2, partial [Funneliformis geosporum]
GEEVTYGIKEEVVVPPFNAIEFGATMDKISIDIHFKAKIRITGKADRLDENVVLMTDVDIDALKLDGYGLASTIETKPLSGYIPSKILRM